MDILKAETGFKTNYINAAVCIPSYRQTVEIKIYIMEI